ncbi:MAG: ATP-binding cassette domain-containing protein, partial [Frisingicoccus sp.]|nr:ATP-binding cassette domain-containing protein [Frisingicoccus sp.]
MTYYFRTEKMSVGYQKVPLIENIEIGLKQGEILTLIGPNGAGKSTVLKSIAKQLSLISG